MPNNSRSLIPRLTAASLLALLGPVAAQSPRPIETDRPDFTESSSTVARGRFQLEAGYTAQRTGGSAVHSLPEALLRVGLSDRVEFRLSQNFEASAGQLEVDDLVLGAKIGLGQQLGARPSLALLAQTVLPTGGQALSADMLLPSGGLLAGWQLDPRWSAGASVLASREAGSRTVITVSMVVGRELASGWKGYAEWFTVQTVNTPASGLPQHYVNGGVTRTITSQLQLDARVGTGMGGAIRSTFVGFGLAVGW